MLAARQVDQNAVGWQMRFRFNGLGEASAGKMRSDLT